MKKNLLLILVALAGLGLMIGLSCSKSYNGSSYTGTGGTASGITMYNMAYSPVSKTVAVGAVVKWTNSDSYAHTVTSNDGSSFDSGTIPAGGTYSYTATVVGTFNYHCTIHGTAMSGTLVVTP